MIDFLLAPEVVAFSTALVLMLFIGIFEAVGLGASGFDLDIDADNMLAWFGIGRVPMLILLIAMLTCFGLVGLIGQQTIVNITGHLAPSIIAIPAAIATALPLTAITARGLAKIMPHDETTAIDHEDLVGRTAVIEIGRAARGSPARAKVVDHFGQPHFIMVEPDNAEQKFEQGDQILLVRKETHSFYGIISEQHKFSNWIN